MVSVKPPLGADILHRMATDREICVVCGMSKMEIVDLDEPLCKPIRIANLAASRAWHEALEANAFHPASIAEGVNTK